MKKIGRWIYCKYCYRKTLPSYSDDRSLIVCSKCGHGLEVIKHEFTTNRTQRY